MLQKTVPLESLNTGLKLTHLSLASSLEPWREESSERSHEAGEEADDEAVHHEAAVDEALSKKLKDSWAGLEKDRIFKMSNERWKKRNELKIIK